MGQDHLAVRVDRQPAPGVAHFFAVDVSGLFGGILHCDEAPHFVQLDPLCGDVLDGIFQEPLAVFANQQNQIADCVSFHSGESFAGPDAHSLQEHTENHAGLVQADTHIPQRAAFVTDESDPTGATAVALSALTVSAVLLAVVVATGLGGGNHRTSLFFCGWFAVEWGFHSTFWANSLDVGPGVGYSRFRVFYCGGSCLIPFV